MTRAPSSRKAWLLATVMYLVFTAAYAWPLLGSLASTLPSDTGDPALNTWILWWTSQATPLSEQWWNAPMFYPALGALALSETLLGLAPFTLPLAWAGASPILVYNLVFLASFPASALAAHALARRLTWRHDAALIAGLAYGFSPYRAAQMAHLQLLVSCWMPLALVALHRFLDERRRRDLALAGVCILLNGLTSGYLLVFFAVLLVLWVLWFARTPRQLAAIGVMFGVTGALLWPVLNEYRHYQSAFGLARPMEEVEAFGADLSSIWAASFRARLASLWTIESTDEGGLYPGIVILGLTVLGLVVVWRARRRPSGGAAGERVLARVQRVLLVLCGLIAVLVLVTAWPGGGPSAFFGSWVSTTRPVTLVTVGLWLLAIALALDERVRTAWRARSPFGFYLLAAVVMFAFALGPVARAFGAPFWSGPPYSWLMELPRADSLRVPARFGQLCGPKRELCTRCAWCSSGSL